MAHRAAAAFIRLTVILLVFGLFPQSSTYAVEPGERLADPALEERAREISKGLRCLVCQNQSIDDSDAELARDLRVLVRDRITAGDSDDEVIDYVVSRYGDFVLLKPPFNAGTLLLWLGPAVILLMGMIGARAFYRSQRRATEVQPLTAEEAARVDAWLKDDTR